MASFWRESQFVQTKEKSLKKTHGLENQSVSQGSWLFISLVFLFLLFFFYLVA
jgi:hypothetical protein